MKRAALLAAALAAMIGTASCDGGGGIRNAESISIASAPAKTEYLLGEELDLAGLAVVAAYPDGTEGEVTGYSITGYNSQRLSLQAVCVSYQGKTAEFAVTVVQDASMIGSLIIETGPDFRTEYLAGEELDLSGFALHAVYVDGTSAVAFNYSLEGFDSERTGLQIVNASYGGRSASFRVAVLRRMLVEAAEVLGGVFFSMGSPEGEGEADERPQRRVILTCFYMGRRPVTQGQYREAMGADPALFGSVPAGDSGDGLPAVLASWYEAAEFCNRLSELEGLGPAYSIDKSAADPGNSNPGDPLKWAVTLLDGADGYRLPTEAEWEYACRAGTSTAYSTGAGITAEQANFGSAGLKPAGSYPPNPLGLYDMHGNVLEWCWDWYDGEYYQKSPPNANPVGPAVGERRVVRGGKFDSPAGQIRSASRGGRDPQGGADCGDLGFRVLRPKYPDGIPSP